MLNSSSSFDASGFIRKFSLRKKKWPDDYVAPPQPQGSKQGGNAGVYRRRIKSNPSYSSSSSSPPFSPSTSPGITFSLPQPLTSFALSELRAQFADQLKCLDSKLDLDVTVMAELHEFYRRRALVEQEYSDSLAKLVNSLKHKHSNETGKRPNWANYTTTTLWNTLLGTTLRLSDTHATLSEIFGKHMVQRLADMDEDANRLHKQCREMMIRCQEKVFSNIAKLQSDQREYGQRQSNQMDADRICKRSEEKLTAALNYIQSKKKEPEKSQKFRRAQVDYNQKFQAFENTVIATNHARNEYLIQLCAANRSIHRYFTDELSDILDCMSCGLHNSLARAAMMHLSCEEAIKNCHGSVGEMINRNITALDWRADKATFLRRNEVAFSRPPTFSFLPFKDDTESEVVAVPPLRNSLAATAADLRANLEQLKTSTEEAWNTLQDIEKKLLVLINQNDYDVSELFADSALSSKRRRRRSASPVNGDSGGGTRQPVPASPANSIAGTTGPPGSGPATAASISSLNKGIGGTPLSSSLPPEEMGSKASVGSSAAEIQPGLYLAMRNTYRDQRIREERVYMERFSAYTQEMHRCVVMQAKLAEIERALANQQAAAASASKVAQNPIHRPHGFSTPLQRPPCLIGDGGGNMMMLTPTSETGLGSPYNAPPPPPVSPTPTTPPATTQPASLVKVAPRRVLHVPNVGRPKLFGGTIDEYVTKTGEQIPRVVLSCIRVINLFGMHHQGVFRVPGSQAEINIFKEAFEYGEDPLVGLSDSRDINSTSGLLKLYFRELGEPPFPKEVFMELVQTVREKRDSDECIDRLASIISTGLSHPVFIVMRYLFAFLNHLSEYSDENMMDPYNLAICFGPTLMPAPADLDQVEFQSNVNDVVKLCINHHRRIFDPTVPGAYYEKFAAYASAVPPVLPRALASEAAKKVSSLRHQATAPALTVPKDPATHGGSDSPTKSGSLAAPGTVRGANKPGVKHSDFSSSADQLSIDDGLDDDNEDVSDSDIEDDDPHPIHATALAAFNGSSARELSFQRGAELFLYRRLNEHWWEGQLASAGGPDAPRYLVPHLYIKPLTVLQSNGGSCGGGGAVLTNQTLVTNGNDINATAPSATNATTSTTDESTSGVDDDGPTTTTTTSYSEKNNVEVVTLGSPPKKPPRRCSTSSVKSSGTESPTRIASSVNESSADSSSKIKDETFPTVTTPESPKGVLHFGVSTTSHRSRSSSPTNNKTEAGLSTFTKVEDVQSSFEVKDSFSLHTEDGTANSPIMTRSMSNSPPPRTSSSSSPLRRSGNRGSWAGVVSSTIANAAVTAPGVPASSTITELETLPEDKPADLKPVKKISVDSIESNGQNNESLHDVDSALAEVIRGLACLEKGRSQGPEANNAAEQRSRELEQKMRLPSAHKPISEALLLKERPKPPNFNKTTSATEEFQLQLQEDSLTSTTDTFAEQAGGTVRKRVSASFVAGTETKSKSLLPTSASLSTDLGRSEQEIKAPAASTASATRWSTRKLAVEKEGGELEGSSGSMMSKSFVVEGRNGGGEKENVTSNSELVTNSNNTIDSSVPIKRGSIAARVAAFEASNASTALPIRPSWVKKI